MKDIEMSGEDLARLNKALNLTKTKDYRPYCLKCSTIHRMCLTSFGFTCTACGNDITFDLTHHNNFQSRALLAALME